MVRELEGCLLSESGFRRRLMAILAADASGYSRRMSQDELGTVAELDAARQVFREHVADHGGRVVDTAGDSVLAVFDTAAGAVDTAVAVQRQLTCVDEGQPETVRLRFRIGVHLGDVIEKPDGSVYGHGVNVAARLQALAPEGGISVSDSVRNTLGERGAHRFVDQGRHAVRNIEEPLRSFALDIEGTLASGSRSAREVPHSATASSQVWATCRRSCHRGMAARRTSGRWPGCWSGQELSHVNVGFAALRSVKEVPPLPIQCRQ